MLGFKSTTKKDNIYSLDEIKKDNIYSLDEIKKDNIYSLDEIKKHNNKDSCWIILNEYVYDLTLFLSKHTGGQKAILKLGGKDGTQTFESMHTNKEREILNQYIIGKYKPL